MKDSALKNIVLLLYVSLLSTIASAQSTSKKVAGNSGISHVASVAILLPFGNFSGSHLLGTTVSYNHSNKRFGWLNNKPAKLIGLTFGGGIAYYFGKKDKTSPAPGFTFKNLLYINATGGVMMNAGKRTSFNLSAGPFAELYAGNISAGLQSNFTIQYAVSKKIAVAPVISCMKKNKADMLWATGVAVSYALK